jgi:chromosomal replication initiator protein
MDIMIIWKAVLAELELSVSPVYFPTWIKPLSITSLEKLANDRQLVTILCPSSYHQSMIKQRYEGQIKRSLERICECPTDIVYIIGRDETKVRELNPAPLFEQQEDKPRTSGSNNLNPRMTFETYVVGGSNNFAYAAAQGASKSPGTRYNPLFIYGGVGLGKTHLMQAAGHAIYKDHPDWNIMYISAETFGSDLIASLQNKKTAAFKKKYRAPNVLLVDDIQFIAGKEYIQEEFFHTFNELYMSQRQVILTSDRPPQETDG